MSERVSQLTEGPAAGLTVSTFHSFGLQLIQAHGPLLGYRGSITVFDTQDKLAMIQEVLRQTPGLRGGVTAGEAASYISQKKTSLGNSAEESHPALPRIFTEYQDHLKAFQAVDFDDLLLLPITLFTSRPEVLSSYQKRFQYILVDEFQDTSNIQYRLLRMLADYHRNLCVVGDDDQSIYSWRGADYSNITSFEKDFPEVQEIKLEQNYRSTGNILEAANHLIANNRLRKQKSLWTGEVQGLPLHFRVFEHETEEAESITAKIRELALKNSWNYDDFGILVRANSLMGTLEHELMAAAIPYTVSGGMSFFARKEVKDVIAYLRITANPHNDVDLLRILNTPRRGLGKSTAEELRSTADSGGSSLYSAAEMLAFGEPSPLPSRGKHALQELIELIRWAREEVKTGKPISEMLSRLLDRIAYRQFLMQEHAKNPRIGEWKYGNVERFREFLSRWEEDHEEGELSLADYLNRISLTGKQEPDTRGGKVSLMTIHASKGLEFPCVFLPAVEDGIIPHEKSIAENPQAVEEERRLFYVALTRAKEALYLSRCSSRKFMQSRRDASPSPFLQEIPESFFTETAPSSSPTREEVLRTFADLRSKLKSRQ